jgi:glycerol uptake facilitator protein
MVEGEMLTITDPHLGEATLIRRLGAEFIGTLLLVAIGAGAIVAFLQITAQAVSRIVAVSGGAEAVPEGQQQFFGELIGGDILGVALAFGLTLAIIIYAFGGVSGGHFNPAVTFALALARRFDWRDVGPYWVAQCLGGIVGALVVVGIFGDAAASSGGQDVLVGATMVARPGIETFQAILAEAAITFLLMTAIMAIAIDPRAPKGWSGLIIGIALAAGILATGAATGGSANFARSLGPMVIADIDWFFDSSTSVKWTDLWIYAVGPLVGASAAALLYEGIAGLERVAPAPGPGAATPTNELLGGADETLAADPHGGPGGGDDAPNPGSFGPGSGPR